MVDINWSPDAKELRKFGVAMLVGFSVIGGFLLWRGHPTAGTACLAGVAMIVLPQIYGAPHPASMESGVPATLAADFVTASLASNLVFWTILGLLASVAMARLGQGDRSPELA